MVWYYSSSKYSLSRSVNKIDQIGPRVICWFMSDAINMHHTTKHNKLGYCHLNGFRHLHGVIVKVDVDIVRNNLSNIIVLKGHI